MDNVAPRQATASANKIGFVATFLCDPDGMKRVEGEYGGRSTLVWDGDEYLQSRYVNGASFVSPSVPTLVASGASFVATLTFQNTGDRIASASPTGNSRPPVAHR